MKYRHVVAYAIRGIQASSLIKDVVVLDRQNPRVQATLTGQPDPLLYEIDRRLAIGIVLLKGFFGRSQQSEIEVAVDEGVRSAVNSRKERQGSSAVLVVEVSGEVDVNFSEHSHETQDYILGFDLYDSSVIRNNDAPIIASVVTSMNMSLKNLGSIEKLKDGTYLVDETGKVLYSYLLEAGKINVGVSSPFVDDISIRASSLINALLNDPSMHRVVKLILEAYEHESDGLRAFLAAWAALEIFVNKAFVQYESMFTKALITKFPSDALEFYLERVQDVMKSRYRLLDKFNIIAHFLGQESAESDLTEFKILKERRDSLLHGENIPEQDLEAHKILDILSKYLKVHLNS